MVFDHLFYRRSPTTLCLKLTERSWASPVAPRPPVPLSYYIAVRCLPKSCQPLSLSIQIGVAVVSPEIPRENVQKMTVFLRVETEVSALTK